MGLRKYKLIPILVVLTWLIISCSPATQEPVVVPTVVSEATSESSQTGIPQTEADVPRVSVEDAVAAIQSGKAVVVDVRSAQAYQASHIPGALSIPLAEIEANPTGVNLDKAKWIITYCT
jgi:3-mercaptopyruvate sulfurtransferase SseA